MATTKATRTAAQDLPLAARLAHEHNMAVRMSTATPEILEEDGKNTDRLVYLGKEYAESFIKAHGLVA
jgi:hypothetical protein